MGCDSNCTCCCSNTNMCDSFCACGAQAAQRFFVLTQTDNLWKEHLQAIKFLQQAVSLRGYAQVTSRLQ